jgi:hypothetical protein
MSTRVVMKVMDKDLVGKDEVVGSILFDLRDCIDDPKIRGRSRKNLNGQTFWKNIYGSPLGVSGDNVDLMNNNPEVASTWKGRILMSVTSEETEKPICQMLPIKKPKEDEKKPADKKVIEIPMEDVKRKYQIVAEVGQGLALPAADQKYKVMIKIAEKEFVTGDPQYVQGNYNRWKHTFRDVMELPYVNL